MPAFPFRQAEEEGEPSDDPLDDRIAVWAWRLAQAHELGYRPAEAELIAADTFDLHTLRKLIEQGRDPHVALRILL
jgi:hypothetical protein